MFRLKKKMLKCFKVIDESAYQTLQTISNSSRAIPQYFLPFHDEGRNHIETKNQWTGFYMIMASVMKVLNQNDRKVIADEGGNFNVRKLANNLD